MRAYIYARFSTMDQAKGSSLHRQLSDCRALCDRKGWERSPDRELVDEGRSAFHGANRAHGSGLADFEASADRRAIGDNAVLVVERLDRLSRQSVIEVFNLVTRITEAGVAIATVDGERLYTKGAFDFANIIELVVKAQVSHEESAKKSHRLSAAWAQKRARAAGGDRHAMTRRCPAWMTVNSGTGKYMLIEDRAALVRRIFDLTVSGFGKHLIASTFNREGIAAWGEREGSSGGWHSSYIQKILGSRAVLGEFQPHRMIAGKRQPEGEVLNGLYPAVIDEVMFARALAGKAARTGMAGRRGKTLSNILSGMVHCGGCRGRMTFRNKGKPGEQYLVCDSALRSRGCDYRTHFNYPVIEATLIEHVLPVALFDRHFAPAGDTHAIELQCINQRKMIDDLAARQERLVDLLSRMENEQVERHLADLAISLHQARDILKQLERDLNTARGKVSPRAGVVRVRELLNDLQSNVDAVRTPARGLIQTALREIVAPIICDPVGLHTTAWFGLHYVRFDRAGRVIETTEADEARLSIVLDRLEHEAGDEVYTPT